MPRLDLDRRYPGISPRLRDQPAANPAPAAPVFASPQAEALAKGLDLSGETPTGATGFTVADIRRILGET